MISCSTGTSGGSTSGWLFVCIVSSARNYPQHSPPLFLFFLFSLFFFYLYFGLSSSLSLTNRCNVYLDTIN